MTQNKWVRNEGQNLLSAQMDHKCQWHIDREREGRPGPFNLHSRDTFLWDEQQKASSDSSGVTMATPVHNWVCKHKHTAGWRHFLSRLRRRITTSIQRNRQPHKFSVCEVVREYWGATSVHVLFGNPQSVQALVTLSRRNVPKMERCWAWTHAMELFNPPLQSSVAFWAYQSCSTFFVSPKTHSEFVQDLFPLCKKRKKNQSIKNMW